MQYHQVERLGRQETTSCQVLRSGLFWRLFFGLAIFCGYAVASSWLVPESLAADGEIKRVHSGAVSLAPKKDAAEKPLFLSASPPPSPEVEVLINRAKEFAAAGRYETTLAILQKVIHSPPGVMASRDGRLYLPARRLAEEMLVELPPTVLRMYRLLEDPRVEARLAEWQTRYDPQILRELVEHSFLSSRGDEAAFLLGCYHLDRYEFYAAQVLFRKILDRGLAPSVSRQAVMARLAFTYSRLGDPAHADAIWREMVNGKKGEDAATRWAAVRKSIDEQARATPLNPLPDQGWQMHLGNAVRNGHMSGFPTSAKDARGQSGLALYWQKHLPPDFAASLTRTSQQNQSTQILNALNRAMVRGQVNIRGQGMMRIVVNGQVIEAGGLARKGKAVPAKEQTAQIIARWLGSRWQPTDQLLMARGKLYYNSYPYLYCIDAESGNEVWRSRLPAAPKKTSTRRITRRVFFGMGGGLRNQQSNTWSFRNRLAHSLSLQKGIVYRLEARPSQEQMMWLRGWGRLPTNTGNALAAYAAETGKQLWRAGLEANEKSPYHGLRFAAAPVLCGENLLVPAEGMRGSDKGLSLLAIEPRTGRLRWKQFLCTYTPNPQATWFSIGITVSGSEVYVVTGEGLVLAVDGHTGETLWATKYRRLPMTSSSQRRRVILGRRGLVAGRSGKQTTQGWQENAAFVVGERLLVLARDSDKYLVFARATGEPEKPRAKGDYLYPVGLLPGGLIVAGSKGAARIDLKTLKPLWQVETVPLFGRGMLTKTHLYLSAQDSLIPVDLQTGKAGEAIRVYQQGKIPPGNLYSDGKRLFLTGMNRIRVMMDPATKLLELTAQVGKNPTPAALANRGGFLLTLNRYRKALPDLRAAYNQKIKSNELPLLNAKISATKKRIFALTRQLYLGELTGEEIYRASLTEASLATEWKAENGTWKIIDGSLRSSATTPSGKKKSPPNLRQQIWLKKLRVQGDFQFRFTGWQTKGRLCDLTAMLRFPRQSSQGECRVLLQFGGFWNTKNRLTIDGHSWEENRKALIQRNKRHKIIVTRQGARLVLVVDGQVILNKVVPALRDSSLPLTLGLYGYGSEHYFRDIVVSKVTADFQTKLAELTSRLANFLSQLRQSQQVGTLSFAELRTNLVAVLLQQAKARGKEGRALLAEALTIVPPGEEAARIRYLTTLQIIKYENLATAIAAVPSLKESPVRLVTIQKDANKSLRASQTGVFRTIQQKLIAAHGQEARAQLTAVVRQELRAELQKEQPSIVTLHNIMVAFLDAPLGLEAGLACLGILQKKSAVARAEAVCKMLAKSPLAATAARGRVALAEMYTAQKRPALARWAWCQARKYTGAVVLAGSAESVATRAGKKILRLDLEKTQAARKNANGSEPEAGKIQRLLWKLKTSPGESLVRPRRGLFDPDFLTGRLFTINRPHLRLTAIDTNTGKRVWKFAVAPHLTNKKTRNFYLVSATDMQMLIIPLGNRLLALDSQSGKLLWSYDLKPSLASAGNTIMAVGGKVYVSKFFQGGRRISSLDAATGRLAWQRTYFTSIGIPQSFIPRGKYLFARVRNTQTQAGVTIWQTTSGKELGHFAKQENYLGYGEDGVLVQGIGSIGWRVFPTGDWAWQRQITPGQMRLFNLGYNRLALVSFGKQIEFATVRTGKQMSVSQVKIPVTAQRLQSCYSEKLGEVMFYFGNNRQNKRLVIINIKSGKTRADLTLSPTQTWSRSLGMTRDHVVIQENLPPAEFNQRIRKMRSKNALLVLRSRYRLLRKDDGKIEPNFSVPAPKDLKNVLGMVYISASRRGDKLILNYANRFAWCYQLPARAKGLASKKIALDSQRAASPPKNEETESGRK